jgi:hypothetical protein
MYSHHHLRLVMDVVSHISFSSSLFVLSQAMMVELVGKRQPRQGGRDLLTEFTFELVCGWIRDHLSADLGWQYTWETNGVGLPPGYGSTAA